ncbi:MAG: glycoside hydrolase family 9 protein [Oscillospiraceae bacterium]|jgi:hypothetical protein|nr:glycoside hydrolase family 9 protein [Oscillospiraceae bacterium]
MKETINQKKGFLLSDEVGYFQNKGVDVMAFDDIYPEGHQGGVSLIMHGNRIASNGDIRFDKLPGQWKPVPKQGERVLDENTNTITVSLAYPDPAREIGFNPIVYPDLELSYKVTVKGEDDTVIISVDLDAPVPQKFVGTVCFILELFPGALFGKPWIMDDKQGFFPVQPNGPVVPMTDDLVKYKPDTQISRLEFPPDDFTAKPYAIGKRFTVRPDDPYGRFTIESEGADLHLYDGRMKHNNGWFVISSDIPAGVTKNAIKWTVTPNVVEDWVHTPVVQASQVGYHPGQPKVAIIELDKRDLKREKPVLYKITENGAEQVFTTDGIKWGQFLRYNYLMFDFTKIKEEGLYKIHYGTSESSVFRIAEDIYDRGVWQPVLEYFLPVQMCHMRVNEKYRVWHDLCHMDDARMAPIDHNHFDGYFQGPSTLTKYKPGDIVPGLNIGGWHDAGDDDLRVESQSTESYILSMAYEEFDVNYDVTTIDQDARIVEIHLPDGKNDILQQIEHGTLSVVGAYRALGRLYRGIIVNSLRQYVLLGDPSAQTDNISGNSDDRWVFTENNPPRELTTAAQLAAVSRVLKGFNDTLSEQALEAARELFDITDSSEERAALAKIHAASELFLTTGKKQYKDFLLSQTETITGAMDKVAWFVARAEKAIGDAGFTKAIRDALPALKEHYSKMSAETPYGIPYRPFIWGAGWIIQRQGYEYYFLHKAYPDIFGPEIVFNSLNFVLGCHPGSNNMSFASGVGTKSALVAYGWNRADWSFCPGGVISGTALIRPDFPELLEFPYLWQQTEYVLGGGSSHYMFLVLAAQKILKG